MQINHTNGLKGELVMAAVLLRHLPDADQSYKRSQRRTSMKQRLILLLLLILLLTGIVPVYAGDQWNTCPTWDCGKNSFSAGTQVATPDGNRAIADIVAGDRVLALDPVTGHVGTYAVTETISHIDDVIIVLSIDGELLETTPWHPFYTVAGNWTAAEDLQPGDQIQAMDGSIGTVGAVNQVHHANQRMYNLVVAEAHSFFVGNGAWTVGG
jgi:hypothetical protein